MGKHSNDLLTLSASPLAHEDDIPTVLHLQFRRYNECVRSNTKMRVGGRVEHGHELKAGEHRYGQRARLDSEHAHPGELWHRGALGLALSHIRLQSFSPPNASCTDLTSFTRNPFSRRLRYELALHSHYLRIPFCALEAWHVGL